MKEKIDQDRIPQDSLPKTTCAKPQPHFFNTTAMPAGEQEQAQWLGIPLEVICSVGIYDTDCAGGCG